MKTLNFESFVSSYLATASWITCDSGENTDFTREGKKIAAKECQLFIDRIIKEFGEEQAMELLTVPGNDLDYLAAHCFFLNRNGHGSGFWDREIEFGEYADKLSNISKEMKGSDCYHVRGKKSKLTF